MRMRPSTMASSIFSRQAGRNLIFWHSNVTSWGRKVEGFGWESRAHVAGIAEHHLAEEKSFALKARLSHRGWAAAVQPAAPSSKSEAGTIAGVLVMSRSYLAAVPVDMTAVRGEDPEEAGECGARWAGVIVTCRNAAVLFIEVYLVAGRFMYPGERTSCIFGTSKGHGHHFGHNPMFGCRVAAGLQVRLALSSEWTLGHGRQDDHALRGRPLGMGTQGSRVLVNTRLVPAHGPNTVGEGLL